jgi:Metallopeptidase family M24
MQKLKAGSLIKMDAGCELHGMSTCRLARSTCKLLSCLGNARAEGMCILRDIAAFCAGYNSDVTRCWPVSGSFSPQQRDIYEAVLEIGRSKPVHTGVATLMSGACSFGNAITGGLLVCRDCIKHIRPGVRVSELHSWSCSQVSHMHLHDISWGSWHVLLVQQGRDALPTSPCDINQICSCWAQVSDVMCRLGLLAWSRRSADAHRRFYPHSLGELPLCYSLHVPP